MYNIIFNLIIEKVNKACKHNNIVMQLQQMLAMDLALKDSILESVRNGLCVELGFKKRHLVDYLRKSKGSTQQLLR